ncbi:ADP-ribosylation factor GTPase-activating protein [Musa troglodytarum]|uniref:ADP-ribosylation factor GTPase-activating protein n=1 Tax=Musa troglodytarum TaxID=320322 RepID=A0A9E7KZH5_9LILI|nr:ADP-ribosylation factor GTPase-activating protein [Musa troglodytarum]
MDHLLGLLRVRVVRGVSLAFRDATGSDPYVVVRMGGQVIPFPFLSPHVLSNPSIVFLLRSILWSPKSSYPQGILVILYISFALQGFSPFYHACSHDLDI